ncbi:MAG TPA: DUF1003 domain-containing protein [Candidatus Saccharimonadales bacterium]
MQEKILNWYKEHKRHSDIGDRAADKMRNGMGSWSFVLLFIAFMAGWAALNTIDRFHHWDEYPFILLNLFLSMLAALQGAILLIAAKRADAISAAMAEHDYRTNIQAAKDIKQLMELNQQQLQLITELTARLEKTSRNK